MTGCSNPDGVSLLPRYSNSVFRRCHALTRLVVLLVVAAVCASACTIISGQVKGTVGPQGGTITAPEGAGQVEVPPGAVQSDVRIILSVAESPPQNTLQEIAQPLGKALEIEPTRQITNARVRLPVDMQIFDRTKVPPVNQEDAFIAVYNAKLGVWIPLMTELDRQKGQLVAVAPHFSLYQAFKAKASQASQVVGHDIAIGFNGAVSAIAKTVDDWFNGEEKKAECADALRDWQVSADAKEVRGCAVSVGSGPPTIRVGNDLRIPYDIPLPRGADIGLTDYDLDAGLTVTLMRAINRPTGTMVVGARGKAQFSMPAGVPKLGTRLDVPMYPDQLGLALDVIFAMLTWLPETKVFREEFSATAVRKVWELGARNLTITQFFVELKGIIERTVSRPAALEIASKWVDASSCAAAAFEHGLNSGNADSQSRIQSTIKTAKDCLATALEAAGSGVQEFWRIIQSIPEGARGLGQVYDGARIGVLHFGGQLNLSIGHEQPDPLRETPWLEVVASDVDCSTPGLGVELRWPPRKHDITGDGILDSFVPVECFTGDASSDTQLEVFDGASNPDRPTRIGVLTTMSHLWNDPNVTIYPFGIKHIRVNEISFDGRTVTMQGDGYTADDCLHCPSYAITQQASWTGNGFAFGAMQADHT